MQKTMQTDAWVSPDARLGGGTTVGRFSVIEEDARIGKNCRIGHNVVIHAGTVIGDDVRIDDGTVIGKLPMKAAISVTTKEQTLPEARIGDGCLIGANVVIYRGATLGRKVLVADVATIREDVTVGERTIVGRGVAIENECAIGEAVKLETNVYVTAYSKVGDRCFIAPCVATSNDNYMGRDRERFKHFKGVTVEKGGRIGVNATILPGKTIGEDSQVAAGAVVTRDTPPRTVVIGSPAKPLRPVDEKQLLENQE
jgi:UDP-2-acetamido-3-amino-2,3-dideoxy-glucuronate N-acetyltransferase